MSHAPPPTRADRAPLALALALAAAALAPSVAPAQSAPARGCEAAATALSREGAPESAQLAAARALGACASTNALLRSTVTGALLRRLLDPRAPLRSAVHASLARLGLAPAATLARVPPRAEVERRARAAVDARHHDPNTTNLLVEHWRQGHTCEGFLGPAGLLVRCATAWDRCDGNVYHLAVEFPLVDAGLGPPALRDWRTGNGASCN